MNLAPVLSKLKTISSIFLVLLTGCSMSNHPMEKPGSEITSLHESFSTLSWLEGTWMNRNDQVSLTEQWERSNDSLFSGKSWAIAGKDTVFFEKVRLMLADSGIYYEVTVRDQNSEQPVSFRYVSDTAGIMVFTNPAHDFPQRILYSHPHPDSLVAWIEGTLKGKFHREEFRMKKTK